MAITALILSSSIGMFFAFGIYLSGADMMSVVLGYAVSAQVLFAVLLTRMVRRRKVLPPPLRQEIAADLMALTQTKAAEINRPSINPLVNQRHNVFAALRATSKLH